MGLGLDLLRGQLAWCIVSGQAPPLRPSGRTLCAAPLGARRGAAEDAGERRWQALVCEVACGECFLFYLEMVKLLEGVSPCRDVNGQ